jgi:hypothetical protein
MLTYATGLGIYALLNKREFRRSPEKGTRYRALPLHYKLACWCGVIPLLVASFFSHAAFFAAGFMGFIVLEGLCVRWYRKNGHLP